MGFCTDATLVNLTVISVGWPLRRMRGVSQW